MRIPRREIHQHCSVYHGVGNVAQLPAVSRLLRDFYLRCDSGISYSSIDEAYSDHHDLRLRFELVLGVDLTASHRYHRQERAWGTLQLTRSARGVIPMARITRGRRRTQH